MTLNDLYDLLLPSSTPLWLESIDAQEPALMLIGIIQQGYADVMQLCLTLDRQRLLPGAGDGWQEQADENGDDSQNDQQLDQSKSPPQRKTPTISSYPTHKNPPFSFGP